MQSDEVVEANEAFYRAFNQRDAEAMDGLWAQSAPVACTHPGWTALLGRDAVMESWRAILSNPNQPRIVSGGESVHFIGEVAIVLCRELVSGAPLSATNVFVREADHWRMVHHHSGPVSFVAE